MGVICRDGWKCGLLALLLAGGTGTACRQETQPPPPFRVALVSSPASPLAATAEAGLEKVGRELGAVTIRRAGVDEVGQRQAVRELGESGVDLVFCIGDGIADVVYSEAAASAGTDFVVLGSLLHSGNVAGIVFRPQEGGFLAGVLAVHAGSGAPGVLLVGHAGAWDDLVTRGYLEGFRSDDPGAELVRTQSPEAVPELAAAGVKVALAPSGVPAGEVLERCRAAGVELVPTVTEPTPRLPRSVAAAVLVNVPEAMMRVAREVREGRFRGGTYGFDLGSGVIDLVVNPDWPGAEEPNLQQALEDARAGITAGIVEVEQLGIGTTR